MVVTMAGSVDGVGWTRVGSRTEVVEDGVDDVVEAADDSGRTMVNGYESVTLVVSVGGVPSTISRHSTRQRTNNRSAGEAEFKSEGLK